MKDYFTRVWLAEASLRVMPPLSRVWVEPASSLAAINGWPLSETRHTYYFWQTMNPRLADLAEDADEAWWRVSRDS